MTSEITVNKNGTRQRFLEDGRLAYSCQYCGTWFIPGRRFVHKYCGESCRVMACRQRVNTVAGSMGGNIYNRDPTTNTQLASGLHEVRKDFKDLQQQLRDLIAVNTLESSKAVESAIKDLKRDVKGVNDNQKINMLISAISPILSSYLKDLMSGNPDQATEAFSEKITAIKSQINEVVGDSSDIFK